MTELLKQHFKVQAVDVELAHIRARCNTQAFRCRVLIQMRDELEFDLKFGAKLHMSVSKEIPEDLT